ncbi:hypothetical protein HBI25_153600 [Parastagonospora nodorum]|nr:hypothetical protein HBI95_018120 [Parastagonospora nodorum]KAH4807847.1 hypothetical protein HBH61_129260 [Parastagonospora nodorum]KAH4937261.1 hypothetical protein HBH74_076950 [Parastagonospora nodorum]KAH4948582.1 hypothetical protein HBH73_123020 [Parastagonospora nodorum]KAH5122395.1 hypothetical protein HBI73_105650 [Parastagonospora nodorum]
MRSTDEARLRLGTGIDAIWQTVTSRENQKASPLLRLPAELRNKIYQYALSDWIITLSYTNNDPWYGQEIVLCTRAGMNDNIWYAATSAILGLRSTCRQLRAETGVLPYTLNNRFSWDDKWSRYELVNPVGKEQPRYQKTWRKAMNTEDFHDLANARLRGHGTGKRSHPRTLTDLVAWVAWI